MPRFLPVLLMAAASLAAAVNDQSAALNAERTPITSDFAAAQSALRNAKGVAQSDEAQQRLGQVAEKAMALRDKVVQANDGLISVLNAPPFLGPKDPSATIKATLERLGSINAGLKPLSLGSTPPYQPKDINAIQVALDRIKAAVDEHHHAAQNIDSRLLELQRKSTAPATTATPGTGTRPTTTRRR